MNQSKLVKGMAVYVSLTTIRNRQAEAFKTVVNIIRGKVVPTHIFLFVSNETYMLDEGMPLTKLSRDLLDLAIFYRNVFTIVYTKNNGPHRKLLPLLAKKWSEDCIIITVDDESDISSDVEYRSEIVSKLLLYAKYTNYEDVIALRARRMGICRAYPYSILGYRWWVVAPPNLREILLMPTGTGGVLYRPKFLHPIVFNQELIKLTKTTDDLLFRFGSLAMEKHVTVGCINHKNSKRKCRSQITLLSNNTLDHHHMWKKFNSSSSVESIEHVGGPIEETRDHNRKLKSVKNLFDINKRGNNDKQWAAAMDFVHKHKVLSFSDIMSKYALLERRSCLPEYWADVFANIPEYANSERYPEPTRLCSVRKCNSEKSKEMES